MFSREVSVHIDAPPEAVFDYITDLKRHPEWTETPTMVQVDDDVVSIGTTFRTSGEGKNQRVGAAGKVLALEPPALFTYQIDSLTERRYVWTMRLKPFNGGTDLSHRFEQTRAQAWLRLINPLVFTFSLKGAMTRGLNNIKANIEAGAVQPIG